MGRSPPICSSEISATTTEYYHAKIAVSVLQTSGRKLEDVWTGVAPNLGELYTRLRTKRNAEADDQFIVHCSVRQVIGALGQGLEGSNKPLVATAGTVTAFGERGVETDRYAPGASETIPRAASEEAVDALVERGVRAGIVRPSPSVHGEGDHGFVPMLFDIARAKGASAYIGDGANRWNAVHRLDAAQVFARAVERLQPGERFHAVAESEVAFREIATAIGERLDLPVRSIDADEAESHFGALHWAVALDCPTESRITRERLDWNPAHPTLLEDLRSGVFDA